MVDTNSEVSATTEPHTDTTVSPNIDSTAAHHVTAGPQATPTNSAAIQFLQSIHNKQPQVTTGDSKPSDDTVSAPSHSKPVSPRSSPCHSNSRSQSRTPRNSASRPRSRDRYYERRSRARHDNIDNERYDDRRYSGSRSRSRHHSRSRSPPPRSSSPKLFDPQHIKRIAELAKIAKEHGVTVNELLAEQKRQQEQPAPSPSALTTNAAQAVSTVDSQTALFETQSKPVRKIFFGNLPIAMQLTDEQLKAFFEAAVSTLGISTPKPIMSVWVNHQKTFCFVEFRSVSDCVVCFSKLQGISLGGRILHVGHTNDYNVALEQTYAGCTVPLTPEQEAEVERDKAAAAARLAATASTQPPPAQQITSTVVLLENMIDNSELVDDAEYADLCADVTDECSKYGTVVKCVIPRTGQPGMGNIYIKLGDTEQAGKAIAALNNRTFSGKNIIVTTYDSAAFDNQVYNSSVT